MLPRILDAFAKSPSPPLRRPRWSDDDMRLDDDGGPGVDHPSIVAAVAAAPDGATILVRSGVYPGDVAIVARSLTLVADAGAVVQVQGELGIEGLAATDRVIVRGLDVETFVNTTSTLRVASCAGTVWIEDVHLESHYFCDGGLCAPIAAWISDAESVHLVRTVIEAAVGSELTSSLYALGSNVSLDSCIVVGGPGVDGGPCTLGPSPTVGSDAVRLHGGSLFSSGSTLIGGEGGFGGSCLFSDCGRDGGNGLTLKPWSGTLPAAFVVDSTLVGGEGGMPGPSCGTAGEDGLDVEVLARTVTPLSGPAVEMHASSPVREGETLEVSLHGPEGWPAWLGVGLEPAFTYLVPLSGVLQGPYLFLPLVPRASS